MFPLESFLNILVSERESFAFCEHSFIFWKQFKSVIFNLTQIFAAATRNIESPDPSSTNCEVGAFFPNPPILESASASPSPMTCYSPSSYLTAGANRFFIIKATNAKAVEVSLTAGLWQFGNQTEKRLLKVIKVITASFQELNPSLLFLLLLKN